MRPRGATICLLVWGTALGACGSGDAPEPRPPAATPPGAAAATGAGGIVVTRDDGKAPPGCGPADVAGVIARFTTSLSRGDVEAARASFAERGAEIPFRWYAAKPGNPARTGGRAFHTTEPGELTAYFRARRAQGERLDLETVASRSADSTADFEFRLARSARDLPPRRAEGKGQVDCARGVIAAWVMSPWTASTAVGPLCPGNRHGRVVACAVAAR